MDLMCPTATPEAECTIHHPSRMNWVVPLSLFLLIFAAYALTATRTTVSLDAWSANLASWRIATSGSASIEGLDLPELRDNRLEATWIVDDSDGNLTVGRSPGVVAAALPAYWISQPDDLTLGPGALTAAFISALAALLMYLAMSRFMERREAALASLVLAFATPVWTISANAMWPHTLTVLGIAGMAWASSRDRWWLVGMFGGVALSGRLHAALIVAIVGILVAWSRRRPQIMVVVGVVSGSCLALTSVWNHWMYGSWDPAAAYDTSSFVDYAADHRLSVTNQLGLWISPDRGILIWTPILVLLLPALTRSWRELPDWTLALLLGGLAYSLLQTTLNRFSGGDSFYGYRIGLEFVAAATPAFALSTRRMGIWAKLVIGPLIGVQVCAILTGAVVEGFFVPTDRVWEDNAFAVALRTNPLTLPVILAASVLAGILAQRIWANPGLERAERTPASEPVAR
jgi:hypothetical protein